MIERLRAFTYERQRLGRAAPTAARALTDVIAVYSAHPSAPLSLHARVKKIDAAAFCRLDVLRLPAMRQSIHLLPRSTAHLAFHATPAPPADRKKRMKHFKFTDKRYSELRRQILEAATEPLTLPELREAVGAEANEFKGVSAQMTRDGELLRVGARSLRSNVFATSSSSSTTPTRTRRSRGWRASTCARSARYGRRTSSGGRASAPAAPSRRSPPTTPRNSTAAC